MIEPAILFGGQRNICDQWNDTSFFHFSFLEEISRRGEMRLDCSWNISANLWQIFDKKDHMLQ
jgi:hypothetical protein